MKCKQFYIIFLFLLMSGSAFAQKAKLNRANRMYSNLDYQGAIELYLEILDKRIVTQAKVNIADCYRKIGNSSEAEYWYSLVVRLPNANPEHKLYYAMALQKNGKCDKARPYFEEYAQEVPGDLRGELLAQSCDAIVYNELLERGSGFYEINNAAPLNSNLDDFGVSFYDKGVVFSSEREESGAVLRRSALSGNPFLKLFYSDVYSPNDGSMKYFHTNPEHFSNKFNTKFNDGPIAATKDGETIFFTRNNIISGKTGRDDDGIVKLRIVSMFKEGDKWSKVHDLPFNSDEYSSMHPSISADGTKLYFASDMPGGYGGYDLYVTELKDGRWMAPMNLGPEINSAGNEAFPFIHGANEELFFASNGHTGRGGLDIYSCRLISKNSFGPVFNLGYPVNTEKDDFGLVLNDEKSYGYFASDREGGAGNTDIYNFKKVAVDVEVLVYDEVTGAPLRNAQVQLDCRPGSYSTDKNGRLNLELPLGKCCLYTALKDDYFNGFDFICTDGYATGNQLFVSVPLKVIPFEYFVEGKAVDEKTGKPLVETQIILNSDCYDKPLTTKTNNKGFYRFELNQNCDYSIQATRSNYLAGSGKLSTKKLRKSQTLNVDLMLAMIPEPKKPEIIYEPIVIRETPSNLKIDNIYFNFNEADIRNTDMPELNVIIDIMEKYPDIIVEIASHTDSRGTRIYNKRLSERRSEAVKEYLVAKGITRNRIMAKGYGEEFLINDCRDGVSCSDERHKINRRTEFKIIR